MQIQKSRTGNVVGTLILCGLWSLLLANCSPTPQSQNLDASGSSGIVGAKGIRADRFLFCTVMNIILQRSQVVGILDAENMECIHFSQLILVVDQMTPSGG